MRGKGLSAVKDASVATTGDSEASQKLLAPSYLPLQEGYVT
jgi:hypothetical protein